jgi:hypothetical protein
MPSKAYSITFSDELAKVLESLRIRRGEERSRLLETLLRENPMVQDEIRALRTMPEFRKGRNVEDLQRLLNVSRAQWERRVKTGQVKLPRGRR